MAFLSGAASAQVPGPYATTYNVSLLSSPLGVQQSAAPQTESFGFGNSHGAALGYDFGNGFKTQIESFSSNAASNRFAGLAAGGNLTTARVMLKGIYEFSDGAWHVKPYIGAGFGMTDVNQHIAGLTYNDWTTAYQVRGGVTLGFTQKLVGSLEYRWTDGSKPTFAVAGVPTKLEVDRHGFTLGINYKY
ncbi:MAG TPA: outer membrane beta-barrel protein [Micropepsaceae bacterium]|nr:outer membrane beta-barrel protein [Micropepsaceae bacterium]